MNRTNPTPPEASYIFLFDRFFNQMDQDLRSGRIDALFKKISSDFAFITIQEKSYRDGGYLGLTYYRDRAVIRGKINGTDSLEIYSFRWNGTQIILSKSEQEGIPPPTPPPPPAPKKHSPPSQPMPPTAPAAPQTNLLPNGPRPSPAAPAEKPKPSRPSSPLMKVQNL